MYQVRQAVFRAMGHCFTLRWFPTLPVFTCAVVSTNSARSPSFRIPITQRSIQYYRSVPLEQSGHKSPSNSKQVLPSALLGLWTVPCVCVSVVSNFICFCYTLCQPLDSLGLVSMDTPIIHCTLMLGTYQGIVQR